MLSGNGMERELVSTPEPVKAVGGVHALEPDDMKESEAEIAAETEEVERSAPLRPCRQNFGARPIGHLHFIRSELAHQYGAKYAANIAGAFAVRGGSKRCSDLITMSISNKKKALFQYKRLENLPPSVICISCSFFDVRSLTKSVLSRLCAI